MKKEKKNCNNFYLTPTMAKPAAGSGSPFWKIAGSGSTFGLIRIQNISFLTPVATFRPAGTRCGDVPGGGDDGGGGDSRPSPH